MPTGTRAVVAGSALSTAGTIAGHVASAGLYSMLNLSLEAAAHRAIDLTALSLKTSATLVNTWIISPTAWFLLGAAAQGTTYVLKKTASGVYSLFVSSQTEPVLLIEDKAAQNPPKI